MSKYKRSSFQSISAYPKPPKAMSGFFFMISHLLDSIEPYKHSGPRFPPFAKGSSSVQVQLTPQPVCLLTRVCLHWMGWGRKVRGFLFRRRCGWSAHMLVASGPSRTSGWRARSKGPKSNQQVNKLTNRARHAHNI